FHDPVRPCNLAPGQPRSVVLVPVVASGWATRKNSLALPTSRTRWDFGSSTTYAKRRSATLATVVSGRCAAAGERPKRLQARRSGKRSFLGRWRSGTQELDHHAVDQPRTFQLRRMATVRNHHETVVRNIFDRLMHLMRI